MKYESMTTLNHIRAADPCKDGWNKLLRNLGKTEADDEPISLLTVLNSNGLDDALWVLSYAMPDNQLARHFHAWCAERALSVFKELQPDDNRVRAQIEMLRNDDATYDERATARAAALNAAITARDTEWATAAFTAARGTVWAAARNAAFTSTRDGQEHQLRKMLGERNTND